MSINVSNIWRKFLKWSHTVYYPHLCPCRPTFKWLGSEKVVSKYLYFRCRVYLRKMVPKIGAKINCLNGPQGFGAQTVLVFVKTLQEIPGEDLADLWVTYCNIQMSTQLNLHVPKHRQLLKTSSDNLHFYTHSLTQQVHSTLTWTTHGHRHLPS